MLKPIEAIVNLPLRVARSVVNWGTRILTEPKNLYNPTEVTNLRSLKRRVEVGDVLLVCGNARISHVVKVLTLSQWSHVVLYVGDRQDLLTDDERNEWAETFGYDSLNHLVIDADPVRGVHLKPVDEWVGLMIRHCRAEALSEEHRDKVVEEALAQLGKEYDIGHIFRLLFFFLIPWELVPETIRRFARDFTLSEQDTICSRVLSGAFHSVGYPIRPAELVQSRGTVSDTALGVALGLKNRSRSALRLLAGGRVKKAIERFSDNRYTEIHLGTEHYTTPADYDLSRFFSVIKNSDDLSIDYRSARPVCVWRG